MVEPDLQIVFPNMTEIVAMNISSLSYTFSPLRTSDGGQYTCTATVNIPQAGIADLQGSAMDTVNVVGEYIVSILCDCDNDYQIQYSLSRLPSGELCSDIIRDWFPLLLLEPSQHSCPPHHWIQTDMLSSAGGHSHSRPSHDSPNSHHSHCDWALLWSHLHL